MSSCETGALHVWNLSTGEHVMEAEGAYDGVMDAALVDGRPLAITGGGDDEDIEVWDLFQGERDAEPLTGAKGGVSALSLTDIDGRAAVVAADTTLALRVWDLATRRPVGEPMSGHTDRIGRLLTTVVDARAVALSEDGDDTTRLWDVASGAQLGDPLVGHSLNSVGRIAGRWPSRRPRSDRPAAEDASTCGTWRGPSAEHRRSPYGC